MYKNLKWAIPEKIQTEVGVGVGGVEDIELSAIIACQVPASYQPLAANKPLLALFSLFTNAITQLAAGYSYS